MSAELAVQKAIVAKLKVEGIAGGRIFDRVTPGAARPYVHIRSMQAVDDGADCVDGQEVFADLDVWADSVGKVEAAAVASAVRQSLHFAALTLDDPFALVEIAHRDTQIDSGDELLIRARMTFVALVERV